jgi:signal transduction histidine kinase
MTNRTRFPIRLKILISLLFVVTAVVSVITFTMATLFHEDKTAYIKGLISLVSRSAAEETQSLLVGYGERLEVYARIMRDPALDSKSKSRLLGGLFNDFPELVAVTLYEGGEETAQAYDANSLTAAGLTKEDMARYHIENPLPVDKISDGEVYISNSTISRSLPHMTLALSPSSAGGEESVVIAAMVRLNKLLRLANRFTVFEVSVADSEGVLLAHHDPDLVATRTTAPVRPEREMRQEFAGVTMEFEHEGTEMLAGFARVDYGNVVATAQIPKSAAYLASRDLLSSLVGVAAVLLALAAMVSLFWARRITRNVELLSTAAKEIAKGQFEVKVDARSRDEIGGLAESFNHMAGELKTREVELHAAQVQLVQSAKLAAFGQLGAGIAHEVKNPLAGIRGCAQLSLRKAEEGTSIQKNLQLIEKETRRCETIIQNLLKFARQERATLEPIDVNATIEDAVAIVHHQLELSRVSLERDLAVGISQVKGNANQLKQVVMNLMMNAQQAMGENEGTVLVSTRALPDGVEIRVTDDGPGMAPEVIDKVFDPFFTTKPSGKGTGLGLSVSFGIIQEHQGRIDVESELGRGTSFVITLPALPLETAQVVMPVEEAAVLQPQ